MNSQTHTPYKSDTEPLDLLGSVWQIDPVSLRRIFLLLTRNHYADPNYFGNLPSTFKAFRYSDQSSQSTVNIINDWDWDPERKDQPNCIVVSVSDITSVQQTMAGVQGLSPDLSGTDHMVVDQCAVQLTHISTTPDSALQMGIISKAFFQGMQPLMRKRLGLQTYAVTTLTAPVQDKKYGNSRELYSSVLNIAITYTSHWTTVIESHRIKRVNFEIS